MFIVSKKRQHEDGKTETALTGVSSGHDNDLRSLKHSFDAATVAICAFAYAAEVWISLFSIGTRTVSKSHLEHITTWQ